MLAGAPAAGFIYQLQQPCNTPLQEMEIDVARNSVLSRLHGSRDGASTPTRPCRGNAPPKGALCKIERRKMVLGFHLSTLYLAFKYSILIKSYYQLPDASRHADRSTMLVLAATPRRCNAERETEILSNYPGIIIMHNRK